MRATIATIAIRARISAYSASPWPSSSRSKSEEISAYRRVMCRSPPSPRETTSWPDHSGRGATLRFRGAAVHPPEGPAGTGVGAARRSGASRLRSRALASGGAGTGRRTDATASPHLSASTRRFHRGGLIAARSRGRKIQPDALAGRLVRTARTSGVDSARVAGHLALALTCDDPPDVHSSTRRPRGSAYPSQRLSLIHI